MAKLCVAPYKLNSKSFKVKFSELVCGQEASAVVIRIAMAFA